jgi:hypothetical protein
MDPSWRILSVWPEDRSTTTGMKGEPGMTKIDIEREMTASPRLGEEPRDDARAGDRAEPVTGARGAANKNLRHYEEAQLIRGPADQVFEFVDVFQNLSKHMDEPNWRMLWGWIKVKTDEKGGQEVGSVVSLNGSVLGIKLAVIEKVTRREPPYRKSWRTFNGISLLVIGHYTLGFEITPQEGNSVLTAHIDYELPSSARARWLGYLLGGLYAKWCVREMLHAAQHHFQAQGGTH